MKRTVAIMLLAICAIALVVLLVPPYLACDHPGYKQTADGQTQNEVVRLLGTPDSTSTITGIIGPNRATLCYRKLLYRGSFEIKFVGGRVVGKACTN